MTLDASDAVSLFRRVKADAAIEVVAVNEHILETSTMERMFRLGMAASLPLLFRLPFLNHVLRCIHNLKQSGLRERYQEFVCKGNDAFAL